MIEMNGERHKPESENNLISASNKDFSIILLEMCQDTCNPSLQTEMNFP